MKKSVTFLQERIKNLEQSDNKFNFKATPSNSEPQGVKQTFRGFNDGTKS